MLILWFFAVVQNDEIPVIHVDRNIVPQSATQGMIRNQVECCLCRHRGIFLNLCKLIVLFLLQETCLPLQRSIISKLKKTFSVTSVKAYCNERCHSCVIAF